MTTRTSRLRGTLVAACTLPMLLAGCSGSDPEDDDAARSNSVAAGDATRSGDGETPDAEVTGTVPELGDPVASRELKRGGITYRLDVFPLERSEGAETVTMHVRLVFADVGEDADVDVVLSADGAFSQAARENNGFKLVDDEGAMAYLPARNENDTALCSPKMPVNAATDDKVYVTCLFGGIPTDVQDLDLIASAFGSFDDVPLR